MIYYGVRVALLVVVAAEALIERRDKGFVFLGQWILLPGSCEFSGDSLYKQDKTDVVSELFLKFLERKSEIGQIFL